MNNSYAIVWTRKGELYTNSNPDGTTAVYSREEAQRDSTTTVTSMSDVWELPESDRIAVPIDVLNEFLGA